MEIKINKEIRGYTESVFWGLSMRQFLFSCLAAGAAVAVYFMAKPHAGAQVVSWLCILCAAPFAAMGLVTTPGNSEASINALSFIDIRRAETIPEAMSIATSLFWNLPIFTMTGFSGISA